MDSQGEVIDGHAVEIVETAGSVAAHGGTLIPYRDPTQFLEEAVSIAQALASVVREQKLVTVISGREHVRVEAWTLLGSMLGVFPVVVWTREIGSDGWEARVEARTRDGAVVGAAEAMCSRSESKWKGRDAYAVRSMAQTRGISKALRAPLGFIMQLAGFDPSPLEEQDDAPAGPAASAGFPVPKTWAAVQSAVEAFSPEVWTDFQALGRAAKDAGGFANATAFLRATAGVVCALRDEFDPSTVPWPTLEDMQRLWAPAVGGQKLEPVVETPPVPAQEAPGAAAGEPTGDTSPAPSTPVEDDVVPS